MIEVSTEALERVQKILGVIPGGVEKATRSALNRTLSTIKAEASRQVRQTYEVQMGTINQYTTIRTKGVTQGAAGYVHYSGTKIPLYKFKVTPKVPETRQPVTATVKKGEGGKLPGAFIAKMPSGNVGVYRRLGKPRFPIEQLMGLSMAQMVSSEDVIKEVERKTGETIDKRLEHEITRILAGYGG